MIEASDKLSHATQLLAEFSAKHAEIDLVREIVRQRVDPYEELEGGRLANVKQARAFALVFQLRSFFDRSARSIKVRPMSNSKKEQEKATLQEKWLEAESHMVSSRAGFVYSHGMWHGVESGEMILGLSFNPQRAVRGRFGFAPRAVDPRGAAYEWTDDGLGCFVTDETKLAGVLYKELAGNSYGDKAQKKARGYAIPERLERSAKYRPTEPMKVLRYYDAAYEYMWIDQELVWRRPHFMNGVPFVVGYFYDVPSDRPEERGRGAISPIRELLKEEETLYGTYASDAEMGSRPLVQYFDQDRARWEIGRMMPGAHYPAPSNLPPQNVEASPNFNLLMQLSNMLNEQIELNTLPKSNLLSGAPTPASGYSLSLQNEPIRARLASLRPNAELCLATHYEQLLTAYKFFNTPEMAAQLAPDDPELYLSSFAVSVDVEVKRSRKKQRSWLILDPDDISDHPQVEVSLNPDLPTDKAAQMSQFDLAMRSGNVPREWAWENILEVEDIDEMQKQWRADWLMQNDPETQEFVKAMWRKEWIEEDPDLRREYEQYVEAELMMQEQGGGEMEQGAEMGQGAPPMSPMDFAAMQQGQGAPMGGAMGAPMAEPPMPTGIGLPSPAALGMSPQGAPPMM